MKFSCRKCGHVLTEDLYPQQKWAIWGSVLWIVDEGSFSHEHPEGVPHYHGPDEWCNFKAGGHKIDKDMKYSIQEGTFMHVPKKRVWKCYTLPERYRVNRNDCTGIRFYPFKQGYGCCDNHGSIAHCGGCGKKIAVEYYDCYDDHHIELRPSSVNRVFKTS